MIDQRRALQIAVAVAALVPIVAGFDGIWKDGAMAGSPMPNVATDSHFRYLSGLLFGIGLAFWSFLPAIERKTAQFQLLTAIVFIGGLARLYSVAVRGWPPGPMLFGLCMELVITPALCLWQWKTAQAYRSR